jgi:hypothetical protein
MHAIKIFVMNGPLDVFANLLQKDRPETREMRERRMRVQRETYEVASIIEQSMARKKRSAHIGPYYCLEVLRALDAQGVEVEAIYRLQQVNRENNNVTGYILKW